MTLIKMAEIIDDLKTRGEHSISMDKIDEGIIISRHGKLTTNYWTIDGIGKLKCIYTKTTQPYEL
jgi:hypothetical protein